MQHSVRLHFSHSPYKGHYLKGTFKGPSSFRGKKRRLTRADRLRKLELYEAAQATKDKATAPVRTPAPACTTIKWQLIPITFDTHYEVSTSPALTMLARPTETTPSRSLVTLPPPLLCPIYEPYLLLIPVSPPPPAYSYRCDEKMPPTKLDDPRARRMVRQLF